MPKLVSNIAQNASIISGATLLSRVLGFFRDVIIAFALGTGPMADAFFVAFRLPNLLRRLFAEGSLTMAFVPVFTKVKQEKGLQRSFVLARSTLVWLLMVLGIIIIFVLIAARPITFLIAPGFANDQDVFQLTVFLVRICFPYILFISGVALSMGILNSLGHFLSPALAPCILNLVLIASALMAVQFGFSVPVALAIGVIIGGIGQWLLQQPFLKSRGFTWRGDWSLKDAGVKRIGLLLLPTVFGAAVYQLNIVLNTILASFLPQGSVSYLYYADRLVQFPLGIFGVALSTAALPSLSSLISKSKLNEFRQTISTTISLNLFVSLPAAAGLIGLGQPIIRVLFQRGEFSSLSTEATFLALIGYALGLPAFCCVRSLISAYYSLEDTKTPVFIAVGCLIINGLLGIWLMQFWDHLGLAVAVSVASWVNCLALGFFLRNKVGSWFQGQGSLMVMLIMSFLMGLACYWTASWGWMALLLIPFWFGVYLLIGYILRISEAQIVLSILTRKRSGSGVE